LIFNSVLLVAAVVFSAIAVAIALTTVFEWDRARRILARAGQRVTIALMVTGWVLVIQDISEPGEIKQIAGAIIAMFGAVGLIAASAAAR